MLLALMVTGCVPEPISDAAAPLTDILAPITGAEDTYRPLSGRVLLWHDWSPVEEPVLEALLDKFRTVHPGVEVISVAVPGDQIVAEFKDRAPAGLGPDLLLLDSEALHELAQVGLVADLSGREDVTPSQYLSRALVSVGDGERLYGLPFAMHSQVLFYNKELVETPPTTFGELLDRAARGERLALNTQLAEVLWGVGAYHGRFVDPEGRLATGNGGLANWLDDLRRSLGTPGIIASEDPGTLRQAFVDREAAYYVADSDELARLREAMGAEKVGVAPLPGEVDGTPSRPVLRTDAFAVSRVSSPQEADLAVALADFLTTPQQQIQLAAGEVGRIPANADVTLPRRMPASTLTVESQARAAAPMSFVNLDMWNAFVDPEGPYNDAYQQLLAGILPASEFARAATMQLAESFDMETAEITAEELCPAQPGAITLWHALRRDEAATMAQLAREFEKTCPGVAVDTVHIAPAEVYDRFVEEAAAGGGPDVFFEASRWLPQLAEQGLIQDLSDEVPSEYLQQFVSRTAQVMRYQNRLYGIPESVTVLGLYTNRALVPDLPTDLDELIGELNSRNRLALPVGFFFGYWGLLPFGGFQFDSKTGAIGNDAGLINWLTWLQENQTRVGFDETFDYTEAEDAFAYEEAAYFVSGPWSLPRLQEEVGEERFSVSPLPGGPFGPGFPMLQVQGTMVNANADPIATGVAVAFGQYLNLPESQRAFLETGNHVTASVTLDLTEYPQIDAFREQAKSSALVVENTKFAQMEALGDELYRQVLIEGADPATAVQQFRQAVLKANGVEAP
jgi:arabinogalactan oligomer/maltooligosaccharide transport system substrate-binding protein